MKELLGVYKGGIQASASWKPRRTVSITIQVTIFCKPLEKKMLSRNFQTTKTIWKRKPSFDKNIHRHITKYFRYYK